jgi:protein-L-isoaspartate(D-aspartate) O-methyltransferase
MVTAAAAEIPHTLLEQLADGGIMIVPVGKASSEQTLLRIERRGNEWHSEEVMPVRFVPLVCQ